jgi:Flp pilus assembly protein TadB
MIGALFCRLWSYLAAAGAVLAAVATVWLSGRRAGRTAAQVEATRQEQQTRARAEAAERKAQQEDVVDSLRRGGF